MSDKRLSGISGAAYDLIVLAAESNCQDSRRRLTETVTKISGTNLGVNTVAGWVAEFITYREIKGEFPPRGMGRNDLQLAIGKTPPGTARQQKKEADCPVEKPEESETTETASVQFFAELLLNKTAEYTRQNNEAWKMAEKLIDENQNLRRDLNDLTEKVNSLENLYLESLNTHDA